MKRLGLVAVIGILFGFTVAGGAADAPDVAGRFGFTGREQFPIENQISLLRVADLDGDGLKDIIVVNNQRSRISLLYNRTGKTNQAPNPKTARKKEINELPPDARFRLESIASEKRISSIVVTDLNGDGRPDIAYYGEPKELIVLYNQGSNTWSTPKRFPIEDGQLQPDSLSTTDMNGDQRPDLVLLGESCIYVFLQKEDHTLADPVKIPHSGSAKSLVLTDADGDGKVDLLLVNRDDRTPFRLRRQEAGGQFGPEIWFTQPPVRAWCAERWSDKGGADLITIAQNSGRAQIAEFVQQPAEPLSAGFKQGQFQTWPLTHTDKSKRGLLWADVNGDGRPDLIVSEPESGQISLYLQQENGLLGESKTFPSLAGVSDLASADWRGDGKTEIFMLSPDEKQLGATRLDEKQRLAFPTLIPLEGKPLVFAAGKLQPGSKPVLTVIVDQDGRRSLVTRTADGQVKSQKLKDDFKASPATLAFHDVNQDGLMDLVVLMPYEKVKVLLQVPGKDFEELDVAPPGGAIEQPWLSSADVDGDGKPELLFAQKNFLRAVTLQPDGGTNSAAGKGGWVFKVKEQINGAGSNSRLIAATAVPNGTNVTGAIFLLDAERKALSLCERDAAGVWQVVRNIPLPTSEFNALQSITFGANGKPAVGLLGPNIAGCLPLAGDVWNLNTLDTYETVIKDGFLNTAVTGDLDNDGRKDIVFLETGRNYIDVVLFDAERKLVPANRWQVFEERTFRGRMGNMPEPREAFVADVTGDGKADLILLVHDRVLVYPQE